MRTPNLLFIYTDEQRYDTLGAYGNSRIQMPNLNRLAAESTVFGEAYVTQPVCTPSRSSLLTGLYPHTNGCTENNIALDPGTPCLPEMLCGEYATGHFGKWHMGDELFAQHGFGEWVSVEDWYNDSFSEGRDRSIKSDYHHFLTSQGLSPAKGDRFDREEACRLPEEYGKPAFLAQEASRFIREHQEEPFALYVNFLEPHMPFVGPRDDQHALEEVLLPSNHKDIPTENQPLKTRLLREHYFQNGFFGPDLKTETGWRRLIAGYWGLCSLVDTYAGKIVDTIDECGLRDNTIVVFTSDHGDMMGSHGLLAKCVMYQEAVRAPLIIRLPGQDRGCRVDGPVSQIDIVPTLLDLMGQPIPESLEGKSLKGIMANGSQRSEDHVFIEWQGPNNGIGGVEAAIQSAAQSGLATTPEEIEASCTDPVRTVISPDGYRYSFSPLGEHELYDLNADPGETHNLIDQPEHAGRVADLLGTLREWQRRTRDEPTL